MNTITWCCVLVLCFVVAGHKYEKNSNNDRIAEIQPNIEELENSSWQNIYKKEIQIDQAHIERPKRTTSVRNRRRSLSTRRRLRFRSRRLNSVYRLRTPRTRRRMRTLSMATTPTPVIYDSMRHQSVFGTENNRRRRPNRCRSRRFRQRRWCRV